MGLLSLMFYAAFAAAWVALRATALVSSGDLTEIAKWLLVIVLIDGVIRQVAGLLRDHAMRPQSVVPDWGGPGLPDPGAPLYAGIFGGGFDGWGAPLGHEFPPGHTNIIRDKDAPPTTTEGTDGVCDVPVDTHAPTGEPPWPPSHPLDREAIPLAEEPQPAGPLAVASLTEKEPSP